MSRVLIFGPGFFGSKFQAELPDVVLSTARIDDADEVYKALDEHQPEFVLNAAAKTGRPNVDWCETNQLQTIRSNTIGALVLAEACQARGAHLTQLASGCVFYGPSPDPQGWREDDHANPSAIYSRSKYAADLLLSTLPNVAILRLRMPIDSEPGPRNLITKLAAYPEVIDVANSVTVVSDLLQVVRGVMEKRATGIFHAVNPGVMRHRDLLALYKELVDPNHTCEWITEEELVRRGLTQKARSNNIMQSTRLKELGIEMRPISVALRDCMEQYAVKTRSSLRPRSMIHDP